jgi:predicted nucleotidyltransferase
MNIIIKSAIQIPDLQVAEFCKKWSIQELALFGSVLRDDFDPLTSDIDILIDLNASANISLFDLVQMKKELQKIFNRPIDLVEKESVFKSRNPLRKKEILESYKVIYEQAA